MTSTSCPPLPPPSVHVSVDGLREEELIRSGNREDKKKTHNIGSGSGEVDDITEALAALPTVLYKEPTTTGREPANSDRQNISKPSVLLSPCYYRCFTDGG